MRLNNGHARLYRLLPRAPSRPHNLLCTFAAVGDISAGPYRLATVPEGSAIDDPDLDREFLDNRRIALPLAPQPQTQKTDSGPLGPERECSQTAPAYRAERVGQIFGIQQQQMLTATLYRPGETSCRRFFKTNGEALSGLQIERSAVVIHRQHYCRRHFDFPTRPHLGWRISTPALVECRHSIARCAKMVDSHFPVLCRSTLAHFSAIGRDPPRRQGRQRQAHQEGKNADRRLRCSGKSIRSDGWHRIKLQLRGLGGCRA